MSSHGRRKERKGTDSSFVRLLTLFTRTGSLLLLWILWCWGILFQHDFVGNPTVHPQQTLTAKGLPSLLYLGRYHRFFNDTSSCWSEWIPGPSWVSSRVPCSSIGPGSVSVQYSATNKFRCQEWCLGRWKVQRSHSSWFQPFLVLV